MILDQPRKYHSYETNGIPTNFLTAPDGIKVSTHAFHTVFEPYENSLGTMVTLRTPRNSAAKETSLLTSSRFLQWPISLPGSMEYLQRIVWWSAITRTSAFSIYTNH